MKKSPTYDENMIKGRIAETLIEQLFQRLGYSVYRFGMENTIPGIMNRLGQSNPKEIVKEISRMPDFVVRNPITNKINQIEVKFRVNGNFEYKNINNGKPENYPYKNAHFIVISKRHIKCLSYSELKEGQKITSASRNYLGSNKDFETEKEIIIEFCKYAIKFFECV